MRQSRYEMMTQRPVHSLILSLCVPTVASMMVTNLYNLVDTYYVDRLGISAGGAVGVVFSLMAVIQAVGFMLGHGSGTSVSFALGQKEAERATTYASTGFFLALACGSVICAAGLWQLSRLMRLLGSTHSILPYARDYGCWILLAAPLMAASCVLNVVLRYEGKALFAMYGLGVGALLNMAGDPFFMFYLGLGIRGAGISTALSQMVSFGVLLVPFLTGRTQCRLTLRAVLMRADVLPRILKNGLPSLMRQGLMSVSSMLFNHRAALYGDAAVAAVSIVMRINAFLLSLIIGIGQGMQPVTGFNRSAGYNRRVKEAFAFTTFLGECIVAVLALACFFGSDRILVHFTPEESILVIARPMLKIQSVTLLLGPLTVYANQLLQSVGESWYATCLSALRSGLCLVPVLLVLSGNWGLSGIQVAQPIADGITFLISMPILRAFLRRMAQEPENRSDG